MNQTLYASIADAIIAAHKQSGQVTSGYAYAVQWPLGHCTVEYRKPLLRDQRTTVIECADGRELLA
jgi:hypothetical protein